MRTHRHFPAMSFLLCLVGLAFCRWVSLSGGTALCITDGCALFQDFSLAGVSLWDAGSAFFGLLLLICLLRLLGTARFCAGAALAAGMGDLGAGNERGFPAVETSVVPTENVLLRCGEKHELTTRIQVIRID